MKQQHFNRSMSIRFKRFTRKSYSVFRSLGKAVTIGVMAVGMLTFADKKASAQTQDTVRVANLKEKELDEITVTASRAGTALEQAARTVTVITRAQIERAPVQSVQDLLKYVSGIDVRQRGANGVQSDVSLRGGRSDQIAILINGVNLSNPQTGHYSFDIPINLSDIERIEIIQGSSSLLFGASAFAGGINIITRKPAQNRATFSVRGGMYGLRDTEASGALKIGNSIHQLSAGYSASDGYTANNDYKIINTLWQSRYIKKNSFADFQAGYNDKRYGANAFYSAAYPEQYDATRSIFASLGGETGRRDGGKFSIKPRAYWNRHYDNFQLFRDGIPNIPSWYTTHNYHRSDVYGLIITTHYTSPMGITSLGGEFRNEGIVSNVLGKPMDQPKGLYTHSDNRSNISFFAEQNFMLNDFSASAAILANNNTTADGGFRLFPSANFSYKFNEKLRIYTSWSMAMRMPTFTDLYYTTKTHIGNSDLLPEESESYEIGLKFRNSAFTAHSNVFYMKGKNVIDWVKENPDDLWESRNLTELNKVGFELSAQMKLHKILPSFGDESTLAASYSFLEQTKDAGNLISNYSLDYLKHKLTIRLNHHVWSGLSATWEYRWQNRAGTYTRYEDLKPTVEQAYSPYWVLDLKLNWAWRNFNFFADVNNLFGTVYYDLGNIPQPGFWFSAGINFRIER